MIIDPTSGTMTDAAAPGVATRDAAGTDTAAPRTVPTDTTTNTATTDTATTASTSAPAGFEALAPVDPRDVSALEARLIRAAAERSLLDIAYRTVDSPLGPLLLAATERGLVRVAFELEGFDSVLEALASRLSPRILRAPQLLDPAAKELEEYFTGSRRSFDLLVDLVLSSGFRQTVQRYLPHIRYGHTLSYRAVAERVGNPKASRAVGTACATNPLPIVVPCHRVVRTDGGLGGYLGGTAAKQTLLTLERSGSERGTTDDG
ncbi:Methylated-DNA--protein-cysteine methyltransferase [bioreactor metagenome]|uniref:methylated-DNA--[protein]-cysteine S-methyltransferase n=2 Tax=root TaxID=1 RepID=A0A645CTK5_9ZZZZ